MGEARVGRAELSPCAPAPEMGLCRTRGTGEVSEQCGRLLVAHTPGKLCSKELPMPGFKLFPLHPFLLLRGLRTGRTTAGPGAVKSRLFSQIIKTLVYK